MTQEVPEVKYFTKDEVARFKQLPLWKEMEAQTKERLGFICLELETGQGTEQVHNADGTISTVSKLFNLTELRTRQVECMTLRYFLTLPDLLTKKE